MKSEKKISIVHTPMQRLWGILVLAALFACGLMVGMGIKSNKFFSVSDYKFQVNECEWAERVLFSEMPDEKTYDVYAHELRLKIYQELERFCGEKYFSRVQFEKDIIQILYNISLENNNFQQDKVQLDKFAAQLAMCEEQIQQRVAQLAMCEEQIQQRAAELATCENLNKIGER